MAATEQDQAFVEYVVKALVDNPDKVEINRTVDERGVLLELSVDPSDMGKIIGKGGGTAKSIRTLLRVLGAKDDARYNLKIVEPEGSEAPGSNSDDGSAGDDTAQAPEEPAVEAATEEAEAPAEDAAASSEADDIKAKAREGIEDLDEEI